MSSLEEHYEGLWVNAMKQFEQESFQLDNNIDNPEDTRYGITLLARPGKQVKQQVLQFLSDLNKISPNQYSYPESDLHITVMSIISCYQGFSLSQINIKDYISIIEVALQNIPPFTINFAGLTASPSCLMVRGYPESEVLQQIRDRLRIAFRQTDLEQSIDQRYAIQTAHSTIFRFKNPVLQPDLLKSWLKKSKETDFGNSTITELELVANDWYQRHSKVHLLQTFQLNR